MRFTLTVPAFLALVSAAFAQTADFDPVTVPTSNQEIAAGAPFTVEWTVPAKYAADTITIELIGGPTQATQQVLGTIATGVKNSAKSFVWNVDATLGTQAFYGLIVRSESNPNVFQYSNPFHIKTGSVKASSTPAGPAHTSSGSYGNLPPADTTTVTTSTGVKTVTLATQSTTQAPVYTPPVYTPPAVTDVTVILNATTTVPCRNSTIAPPTLSAPTTLQSATRLPPPPPSSPVYVPPGVQTSAVYVAPSAPSASNPAVTAPPTIPTNGGARVGGSALALVASLVAAYFAL
ncbi:Phytase [Trichoderma simmonsii]|uniref:Phytase n=1 Tax=Trichoderma simmonsii TaxID=1491479 RepID=A0A8G0LAJ8_9HYPO|nr:hypothetical protein Trihar35433_937 [Trichoderma harzianum]QYS98797.1 Phytase [Trichoderma simmonsii]